MKAMIWKELRENVKWAVLGGAALTLAMVWVLHSRSRQGAPAQTILGGEFLIITTFGFAALGAALGFLQMFGESRRDHWAFLLHRPISRSRIFFGKVIAGLSIYVAATGLPLLTMAKWASTPGQFAAPFDWGMAQAGLADLLAGTVYYFAALLTALRQARWYAGKALSFGVAIVVSIFVNQLPQFWHALLAVALAAPVLLVAAWGSFCHSGVYTHQRRAPKAALGLATFVGIFIVGSMVVPFVTNLLHSAPLDYKQVQYNVTRDGVVVRMTYTHAGFTDITDLDGNPVEGLSDLKILSHQDTHRKLLYGPSVAISANSSHKDMYQYQRSYRHYPRWFINVELMYGHEYWYFDMHGQRLLGFNARTRRLTTQGGPQGFVDAPTAPAAPFGPWQNVDVYNHQRGWLLVDPEAAYFIDCTDRKIEKIFTAQAGETLLGGSGRNMAHAAPRQDPMPTVIATDKRLAFRTENDQPWRQIQHELDTDKYPTVAVMVVPDKPQMFLRYTPNVRQLLAGTTRDKLLELDGENRIVNRYDLDRARPNIESNQVKKYVAGAAMPPVFIAVVFAISWTADLVAGTPGVNTRDIADNMKDLALIFTMGGSALVCAWLNRRRALRYRLSAGARRWWTLWGLLLTPAGVVLMWCLPDWPARVRCALCGRRRVVERERCEHCGAAFPDPPRDGTEIFEAAPLAGAPAR